MIFGNAIDGGIQAESGDCELQECVYTFKGNDVISASPSDRALHKPVPFERNR